jgi:hypothetical protein
MQYEDLYCVYLPLVLSGFHTFEEASEHDNDTEFSLFSETKFNARAAVSKALIAARGGRKHTV